MPVTVRGTDILFNDGTTQSTAAGGSRSWQSFSLGNNVTYTNTYGKEIVVAARCNGTGGYGFTDQAFVNDVLIVNAYWNAAVVAMTYIFEVPPGATFRFYSPTGVAGCMIFR